MRTDKIFFGKKADVSASPDDWKLDEYPLSSEEGNMGLLNSADAPLLYAKDILENDEKIADIIEEDINPFGLPDLPDMQEPLRLSQQKKSYVEMKKRNSSIGVPFCEKIRKKSQQGEDGGEANFCIQKENVSISAVLKSRLWAAKSRKEQHVPLSEIAGSLSRILCQLEAKVNLSQQDIQNPFIETNRGIKAFFDLSHKIKAAREDILRGRKNIKMSRNMKYIQKEAFAPLGMADTLHVSNERNKIKKDQILWQPKHRHSTVQEATTMYKVMAVFERTSKGLLPVEGLRDIKDLSRIHMMEYDKNDENLFVPAGIVEVNLDKTSLHFNVLDERLAEEYTTESISTGPRYSTPFKIL